MIVFYIFVYIFVWFSMLFVSSGLMFIEDKPKAAARVFLAAWVWPLVAVYIVLRYGRGFVSNLFKTAELHEFVIQERDLWQGADAAPVGRERR